MHLFARNKRSGYPDQVYEKRVELVLYPLIVYNSFWMSAYPARGQTPASCCLQPDVLLLFIASLIILSVVTAVLCGILHDYPCCLNLILQGRREESALDLPAAD